MSDLDQVVFVVDDDVAVRESVSILVEAMNLTVQCFDSAVSFLNCYTPAQPGCLILDIKMPEMDGLDLLDYLKKHQISIPVIVVSGHGDIPQAVKALKSGAIDFLEKPYPSAKLRECITDALERDKEDRQKNAEKNLLAERLQLLTDQEKAVLKALVAGDVTKKIAADLDVSLRTVQFRRESIMKKLQVKNRAELVRFAGEANFCFSE